MMGDRQAEPWFISDLVYGTMTCKLQKSDCGSHKTTHTTLFIEQQGRNATDISMGLMASTKGTIHIGIGN